MTASRRRVLLVALAAAFGVALLGGLFLLLHHLLGDDEAGSPRAAHAADAGEAPPNLARWAPPPSSPDAGAPEPGEEGEGEPPDEPLPPGIAEIEVVRCCGEGAAPLSGIVVELLEPADEILDGPVPATSDEPAGPDAPPPAPAPPKVHLRASTDSSGVARFEVPTGFYIAKIEAEGYARAEVSDFDVLPGETARERVELNPACTLAGRVIDGHGRPIAGARVDLSGTSFDTSLVTDAEGRFGDRHVAPGRYYVAATAEGYGQQGRDVIVRAGEVKDRVEIMLQPEAKLVALVRCPGPCPEAIVSVMGTAENATGGEDVTDDKGQVKIGELTPGKANVRAVKSPAEHDEMAAEMEVQLIAGEEVTVTLDLRPTGGDAVVSGSVKDDEGNPVQADVEVACDSLRRYTSTWPDGRFKVGGLVPGDCILSATDADAGVSLPVKSPGEVEVRMPSGEITVVLAGGETNDNATVWLEADRGAGYHSNELPATFRRLGAGKYTAYVRTGSGSGQGTAEIASAGHARIEVSLGGGLTIRGRVVSSRTGSPVPEALVAAPSPGPHGAGTYGVEVADLTGAFVVKGVSKGRGMVSVTHDGFLSKLIPVEITADLDLGVVALEPGTEVNASSGDSGFNWQPSEGGAKAIVDVPDGPAALAGLKNEDLVVAIDGVKTDGLDYDALDGLLAGAPGTSVRLTVMRDGRTLNVEIPR